MTINVTAATLLALTIAVADECGIPRGAVRDNPERHPEGVHRARDASTRPARRCGCARTRSRSVRRRCRAGTRSASAAITSARPAATPSRRWRSRSPTASPTSTPPAPPGWPSTPSRPGCRSSSTRTRTCWRRSPSSAPPGCGHGSCTIASGQKTRARRCSGFTQTAGSTLAAEQPLNNVVRTTIEALAAVLGGAQSLHTNGYDEALALPTRHRRALALRTQQIPPTHRRRQRRGIPSVARTPSRR